MSVYVPPEGAGPGRVVDPDLEQVLNDLNAAAALNAEAAYNAQVAADAAMAAIPAPVFVKLVKTAGQTLDHNASGLTVVTWSSVWEDWAFSTIPPGWQSADFWDSDAPGNIVIPSELGGTYLVTVQMLPTAASDSAVTLMVVETGNHTRSQVTGSRSIWANKNAPANFTALVYFAAGETVQLKAQATGAADVVLNNGVASAFIQLMKVAAP